MMQKFKAIYNRPYKHQRWHTLTRRQKVIEAACAQGFICALVAGFIFLPMLDKTNEEARELPLLGAGFIWALFTGCWALLVHTDPTDWSRLRVCKAMRRSVGLIEWALTAATCFVMLGGMLYIVNDVSDKVDPLPYLDNITFPLPFIALALMVWHTIAASRVERRHARGDFSCCDATSCCVESSNDK